MNQYLWCGVSGHVREQWADRETSEVSGVGGRVGTLDSGWTENRVVERAERQLEVVGAEQVGGAIGRSAGARPAAHGADGR